MPAARDLFFELSSEPLAIATVDGYITDINPAWEALLGWTAEDMRERPFIELVHPHDQDATVEEASRALTGDPDPTFRNRYRTRSGRYLWLEWRSQFESSQQLFYCAVRDVTERVEAQHALEARVEEHHRELLTAGQRLEAHVTNTPLAVVEFGPDFRVRYWSPRAEALFGWPAEEVLGRHPQSWNWVHEDDLPGVIAGMKDLVAGERLSGVLENRNYTRTGEVLHCRWFDSAVFSPDGRLASILMFAQDVTARRQAEQAAAEREAEFRATFEDAPVGIAHVGLDGSWLRLNETLCRFLGYSAEELMRKTFQEVTHPDDLEKDLQLAGDLIAGRIERYEMRKRYIRRNGRPVWAKLTGSVRRADDGHPLHFIAVVEDITAEIAAESALQAANDQLEQRVELRTKELAAEVEQRRQIERALRESDARVRSILEHSHDAFISTDEAGCVIDWNRAAESLFGYPREETVGRPLEPFIVPERMRGAHAAVTGRYMATGHSDLIGRRLQLPAIRRDGHEFTVEITVSAIEVAGRTIFCAFLHDVSARFETERVRAEAERRMRTITEKAPAMITYVDSEERYRFVNPAFAQWYDIVPEELVGKTIREYRGEEKYAFIGPMVARALAGEVMEFEQELEGPSGDKRYCKVSYIPDTDDQGRVLGFHGMTIDLTAQRRLAQVLEQRALTDELTGLPNRAAWRDELPRGLARAARAGLPAAVMFLDLDQFKAVNDSYGHSVGDLLLQGFAERLRSTLRQSDLIARLSGDEFVVLLDRVGDVAGHPPAVAAKILAAMETPLEAGPHRLVMQPSIGIAVQKGPDFDAELLMRRADEAMYIAKRSTSGRYEVLELH